ncbi:MucBP domain-containing protein [Enterococcus faecalis]|uniref:MucBP domain-containing protein n=1 Tax=Enterococcus faecalis TaxID=1351 RepID=UPI0021C67293|nr:MucBP domain-containing protein [Enterococcus faecalis]MCU2232273.1 MucBP domain-containing protein [Enterococcus faecalis]
MKNNIRFRLYKTSKKCFVSSIVTITVLFGSPNLVVTADAIANSPADRTENSTTSGTQHITDQYTTQANSKEDIAQDQGLTSTKQTSESINSMKDIQPVKMSGLTLDMDTSTQSVENTIAYTLTSDGVGWPNNASSTRQFSVSASVITGDEIKITVPSGLTIETYDIPSGATVTKTSVNGGTNLTYTFSMPGVQSFNISYYMSDQGDNHQFSPGSTTLPITVEGGGQTLNSSIVVTNPITSIATARTHNTAVANNVYTADGNSIYNFVLGVKTDPDFTASSAGITQAQHVKVKGIIHVPSGFVLVGGHLADYRDTNENVPDDGSAIPNIPDGLSQPNGAGGDIIVSNVTGGGYFSYNEAFMYLYGYFKTGTASGTYHFTPDLTLIPQYYDGSVGNEPILLGNLDDVVIGAANPGTMTPMFGGVLEGYDKSTIDPEHEGFYSKTISNSTGVTGFVTGKESDTTINKNLATPNLSVNFLDDTVNQTNRLKDYKFTLPTKWCGNLTDISFATGPNGSVTTSGNLNAIGPFTVVLDNGSTYTVSTLASNDAKVTAALDAGAHIVSVAGQANILAGNNVEVRLLNAVIEDKTYNNGESVPIILDVHSVTTDKDMSVTGHLKYFDDSVSSTSQFSLKGTVNYDISGTYTQGQTFTTGAKWAELNKETTMDGGVDGKIIIPGSATTGVTAKVKLPTLVISSIDKGMIDIDQSKITEWGWTYKEHKYYPVITDLGIDPTTGEHLTQLDFSKDSVIIPADMGTSSAFFYPDALPWKVSDVAAPMSGTTVHWVTQLTDNNKDELHPIYGGKVYDGSTGMKWTITAPSSIISTVGLSGNRTGDSNYYKESTGKAGFDRGLRVDKNDDDNSGKIMLSITNGSNKEYTNAQTLAVLPQKTNGDTFDMVLTGPVLNLLGAGAHVVYSTKIYSLPKNESNTSVDLTTSDWVDEKQVSDWSSIRTVAIKADKLKTQTTISGFIPVQVAKIGKAKIGETAKLHSYSYAKGTVSGANLSNNVEMTAQIYGIPQITVHYEETINDSTSNGNILASEEKNKGKDTNGEDSVDESYTSKKKDIKGYTFSGLSKDSAPSSGTLTDNTSDITYLYKKIPVPGGNITVKYVDTEGKQISYDVVKKGNVGESYSTEKKIISGYTFKEVQGDASGHFTEKMQTVTYVYTHNSIPGGNVTAKYVDTKGKTIAHDVVKTGNIGNPYSTEKKTISDYTFKEVQGNVSGHFSGQPQTVTYVYTHDPIPSGNIIVKYVDTRGQAIAHDVVKIGKIGGSYLTEKKEISGYKFKEVQGNPIGQFTVKTQVVTYVYTKDKINPKIKPDNKDKTRDKETTSTAKHNLPETGENDKSVLVSIWIGIVFLGVALITSVLRFRKLKKNYHK